MSEAVQRARQAVSDGAANHELLALCADTIESLTAEVERLRNAPLTEADYDPYNLWKVVRLREPTGVEWVLERKHPSGKPGLVERRPFPSDDSARSEVARVTEALRVKTEIADAEVARLTAENERLSGALGNVNEDADRFLVRADSARRQADRYRALLQQCWRVLTVRGIADDLRAEVVEILGPPADWPDTYPHDDCHPVVLDEERSTP